VGVFVLNTIVPNKKFAYCAVKSFYFIFPKKILSLFKVFLVYKVNDFDLTFPLSTFAD
jgi:hypothetical protein